jgi:nuclear protein localization family protein 4
MGFLYGYYEPFPDVPLGIKAIVTAIYEPPQESTRDGIKLIKDESQTESRVNELSSRLGLKCVGWMFTDLVPDKGGLVRHYRGTESHFLSAQECIMAGHFQSRFPNACAKSSSGYFGSKFCTVVVTGNKEGQVHTEGYQVTF